LEEPIRNHSANDSVQDTEDDLVAMEQRAEYVFDGLMFPIGPSQFWHVIRKHAADPGIAAHKRGPHACRAFTEAAYGVWIEPAISCHGLSRSTWTQVNEGTWDSLNAQESFIIERMLKYSRSASWLTNLRLDETSQ
jgi:hypothetical protein